MPPTTSPSNVKHPDIIKVFVPYFSNFVLIKHLTRQKID